MWGKRDFILEITAILKPSMAESSEFRPNKKAKSPEGIQAPEAVPQRIIEGVVILPFFDRNGNFLEYRGTSPEGKPIVYKGKQDEMFINPVRVRVVAERRPGEQKKGVIKVELVPEIKESPDQFAAGGRPESASQQIPGIRNEAGDVRPRSEPEKSEDSPRLQALKRLLEEATTKAKELELAKELLRVRLVGVEPSAKQVKEVDDLNEEIAFIRRRISRKAEELRAAEAAASSPQQAETGRFADAPAVPERPKAGSAFQFERDPDSFDGIPRNNNRSSLENLDEAAANREADFTVQEKEEEIAETIFGERGKDKKYREALPEHRAMLEDRAKHLKRSAPFQAVADMLRDPELSHEYQLMVSRKTEMLALQNPGERHRALTPMLVGLMMGERTKPLLDMAIDTSVEERSRDLIRAMRQGQRRMYVRETVVGSGLHGAIWNVNRQMVVPNLPAISLDRNSRIGGQFAQMQSPLFGANSRTRPMLRETPALPGTPQTLNTFTDYAATSPADTSAEAYPRQSVMGDHARLNLFLSGEPIVGVDFLYARTADPSDAKGDYIVGYLDSRTNKVIEHVTDRIILTTGVGEEKIGLDENDETTRNILAAERAEYELTGDARVMSFTEVSQQQANPENPFPMRGFKQIIASGDGDGMKVLLGMFLGYEGQRGMTATQMDFVESITWIGQSFPTKEEFIEGCRARYHLLGLDFPRMAAEGYYARIKPEPGFRAQRLRESGNNIVVIARGPDGQERRYQGDHYIYSHGFEDQTNNALRFIGSYRFIDLGEIRSYLADLQGVMNRVQDNPLAILFSTGKRVELRYAKGKFEVTATGFDGTLSKQEFAGRSAFRNYLENTLATARNSAGDLQGIEYVEQAFTTDTTAVSFTPFSLRGIAGGRPTATKCVGEEIYKVGPASGLELTDEERRRVSAFANIPENSAALFRFGELTADLSRYLAGQDKRLSEIEQIKQPVFEIADGFAKSRELTVIDFGSARETFIVASEEKPIGKIPYTMPAIDLLRFGIGESLEDIRFPEKFETIEATVTKRGSEYAVTTVPALSANQRFILQQALGSGYAKAAIDKLAGEQVGTRSRNRVKIILPFTARDQKEGKCLDVARVRYEVERKRAASAN